VTQLFVTHTLEIPLLSHVERSVVYAAAEGELMDAADVDADAAAALTAEGRLMQAWRALCHTFPAQLAAAPTTDEDVHVLPPEWMGLIRSMMCPDALPAQPADLVHQEDGEGPEYGA
jgi:hypothetical protein